MRYSFLLFLASAMLSLLQGAAGACTYGEFSKSKKFSIYDGIVVGAMTMTCGTDQGLAHIAVIDLETKSLSFTASPLAQDVKQPLSQRLTSQFLVASGTKLAINANLFTKCCSDIAPALNIHLRGLEISHGRQVSPFYNDPCPGGMGFPFDTSLVFAAGSVAIATYPKGSTILPGDADFAVTGSHALLRGGAIMSFPVPKPDGSCPTNQAGFFKSHPRTGAGLSSDRKTLYLVAVDAANKTGGITLDEEGDLFLHLKATDALNLDGGGSTTMVELVGDHVEFVNVPSDPEGSGNCTVPIPHHSTCERYVGATLAVQATLSPPQ